MNPLTCFISKFLNTDDINEIARNDPVIGPHYLGCYPADVTPDSVRQNCCWVWNVDEQDKPGTHWVCVAKKNKEIVFFDSYGKTPRFFKRSYWLTYFRKLGCNVTLFSKTQRQAYITRTCGVWCLLFLWGQYSGQNILQTFSGDVDKLMNNEQMLQDISYRLFPRIKSAYKRKCMKVKGQICKTYLEIYNVK